MMNNDYILRSDIQKAIGDWFLNDGDKRSMMQVFEDIPAADVEPKRKTGRWKRIQWVKDEDWQEGGYWILRCSECVMPYHNPTLYCPHCGAKMMSNDEIADGIGQTFSPD